MTPHPRLVVILCGPAGSGKTTAARDSGLDVYDRDDDHWHTEQQFTQAIAQLKDNPTAQAVIIRSAATSTARTKWANLTAATHTYVMPHLTQRELAHRVAKRNRADKRRGIASINTWYNDHDTNDNVKEFPGWDNLPSTTSPTHSLTRRDW